jgi:penicillin-binding protein 1A
MTNNYKHAGKKKGVFLEIVIFLISLGIVIGSVMLIWISSFSLPDFSTIATRQLESTTKIYDRTGKTLLFAFREKIRRTPVAPENISNNIVRATIAIEDDQFYQHSGISIKGIARAFYVNFTSDKMQGGSTITQQVVKNALLTQERTIERKIKEVILAIKLEQTMSKDDILYMYLNDNPYGGEIYGVEEASLYYFNKHVKDLNLTEAAYLAAIPKNPPLYSPYIGKMDKLEERKNLVLQRMFETGAIDWGEMESAKAVKVDFVKKEDNNSKALHFVFLH